MDIQAALQHIIDGGHLSEPQMSQVMEQIMTGNATQAQIGGVDEKTAFRLAVGELVDRLAAWAEE